MITWIINNGGEITKYTSKRQNIIWHHYSINNKIHLYYYINCNNTIYETNAWHKIGELRGHGYNSRVWQALRLGEEDQKIL